MQRVHAGVGIAGLEHHRRIFRAPFDVVVGRVLQDVGELLRVLRRAVLGHPQRRQLELVVADHVEQRHVAQHCAEQIGPLGHGGAHQQPAVRSAGDGQPRGPGVLVRHQPFGGRNEIVEDVLLAFQHSGAVPLLAELGAPAEVSHGENAS